MSLLIELWRTASAACTAGPLPILRLLTPDPHQCRVNQDEPEKTVGSQTLEAEMYPVIDHPEPHYFQLRLHAYCHRAHVTVTSELLDAYGTWGKVA
jgi:hypothetical protein